MDIKEQMNELNQKINNFNNFVVGKLRDFPNLTLGEQISYPSIGVGFVLTLIGMVMLVL